MNTTTDQAVASLTLEVVTPIDGYYKVVEFTAIPEGETLVLTTNLNLPTGTTLTWQPYTGYSRDLDSLLENYKQACVKRSWVDIIRGGQPVKRLDANLNQFVCFFTEFLDGTFAEAPLEYFDDERMWKAPEEVEEL